MARFFVTLSIVLFIGSFCAIESIRPNGLFNDQHRAEYSLFFREIPNDSTSVWEASAVRKTEILDLLFRAGNSPDAIGPKGTTPFIEAVLEDDYSHAAYLLKAGANPHYQLPSGENGLSLAVKSENLTAVEFFLDSSLDPSASSPNGRGLVGLALDNENWEIINLLLEAGADPDSADRQGNTPLRIALLNRALEQAENLFHHGAKLEKAELPNRNPLLILAIEKEDYGLAQFLLEHGADPENGTSATSPLELAWQQRDWAMAEILTSYGAAPKQLAARALKTKEWEFVDLFTRAGDALTPTNLSNTSPTQLAKAIAENDLNQARFLLANGADPSGVGVLGQPLIIEVVTRRIDRLVELLIAHGADPNTTVSHPATDQFRAFFQSDSDMIYSLRIDRGVTPLMIAAALDDESLVTLLLEAGASKSSQTAKSKTTALYIAGKRRHTEVQQLLLGRTPDLNSRKIIIDLSAQRATFYKNGTAVIGSKVSTGKSGHRTPKGTFVVTSRHRHHQSNLYDDAPMPYFLRFSCDAFGLHEGYVPNYPASHGCIRVPKGTADDFYRIVELGDIVVIKE